MRVGVIGPTDIRSTSLAAGLEPALCESAARQAGVELARRGCDLVVVPDRGVGLLAAQGYHGAGGRWLVGIVPQEGTPEQTCASCCEDARDLCDEVVDDLPWTEQHKRICKLSDALLCIGLSCGTLSEIAWTKWVSPTPVVVIESLLSGIPPEMAAETELHYVEDLEGACERLDEIAQGMKRD